MILEPKHKNFKDQYKINERVKKHFYIRRHMSILVAFEWLYFQAILNLYTVPLINTPLKCLKSSSDPSFRLLHEVTPAGSNIVDIRRQKYINFVSIFFRIYIYMYIYILIYV